MSWILSTSCSGPWDNTLSPSTSLPLFAQAQEWIAYILFSQCPQHAIAAIMNLAFVVVSTFLNLCFRHAAGTACPAKAIVNAGWKHILTVTSVAALATASVGITICQLWEVFDNPWIADSVREILCSAIEASAWVTLLAIIFNERKWGILRHPLSLRTFLFTSFVLSILQFMSSIFRMSARLGLSYNVLLEVFDIYSLIKFPIACFLLVLTRDGQTGLHVAFGEAKLNEPLLRDQLVDGDMAAPKSFSAYENANIFSRAMFTWLNPVLLSGSRQSLNVGDVPMLASCDMAESMFALFQSKWPERSDHPHPMGTTLIRCFWKPFLLTGLLQFVRTLVLYVGPLLIGSFTTYTEGYRASLYDGYVLVLLLLAAKLFEVFTYHHYNFQCYKLGNNVRTAVITALYRKGLRLSSLSRQKHGLGQITNYMVVDAQQFSDACLQLHSCWCIPLQVVLAMVLLYQAVGIAAMAGMAVMLIIAMITGLNTQRQRYTTTNLMKARDTRMKVITEVLSFMKLIKLHAWEKTFLKKIEECRQLELDWLIKFIVINSENLFTLWNTLPLVSVSTYVTAALLSTGLTTAKVFTATSIFRIIREPVRNFPRVVTALSQVSVSLERLDKYMLSSELDLDAVLRSLESSDYPIVVEKGCFAWADTQEKPTLHDIDITVKKGSLVTIVGIVGSGKSSLLAALLGEMVKISGIVKTVGSVAYVSQTAWIQNATIKDNILFGSPFEPLWYKEVVHACGLELDLASMDHGDQTEIGEKGINLSGGQKQRIQLARAIYQNCDIYFLDDVFSAVDAHTGSHLFKECILRLLKGKTVVLITHQMEFLKGADLVVVMKEGAIVQSGSYEKVLTTGTDFALLVSAHTRAMGLVDQGEDKLDNDFRELRSSDSLISAVSVSSELLERLSTSDTLSDMKVPEGASKLIEEEQRELGQVSWSLYWLYLTKAFGWGIVVLLFVTQSAWQVLLVGSDYWLANEIPEDSDAAFNKKRFITGYVLLTGGAMIGVLIRVVVVAVFGVKTAQLFFLNMLHSIFRAPMSFFDTTPSGRILSRFSSDQTNLDFILHFFLGGSMGAYFTMLGSVTVICISTWPVIFLILALGWLYVWYQRFYLTSSREITRLDSITKAPLIYHFSETVAGVETIRSFRKEASFVERNLDHVNTNMKMDFHNNTATEWLGLRLELIGVAILCTTAFLLVVLPANSVKPETVGLVLSYALGLSTSLFWTVWLSCTIENKMVSVERIRQFTELPSEAAFSIPNNLPSAAGWPTVGKIVSTRLKLRYRPAAPLVLKSVTFHIEGGQKVGVVGRTGSGKSTLVVALFRLVEPVGGQIVIDDVDIATIGLHDLRSKMGIIPQDPVLFKGTVRLNMDPLGVCSDEDIWRGLEKCQLAHVISEKPEKLEASVTESGSNWSVGQRQLLCFGRALLKHSRILFLDEATASVDAQTDAMIQQIIREEFIDCTVVSIAHRIPTVMDCDKVLVMKEGRVKEFDSPFSLLQDQRSLFSSLVHEYTSRATQS